MAKTNPIGVRFDEEILNEIGGTAQNVLSTLENMYKASQIVSKNFLTSDRPVFKPENIALAVPKDYIEVKNIKIAQNKPHTDTIKENVSETMPEGLHWKEQLEWKRNHKK